MHNDIKQHIDSGNIAQARYAMRFALGLDPSGISYKADRDYCANAEGFYEPHKEITPFRSDRSQWDNSYWEQLKNDLLENYSRERYDHMLDVVKVVFAEKAAAAKASETQNVENYKTEAAVQTSEQRKTENALRNTETQRSTSVVRTVGTYYKDQEGNVYDLNDINKPDIPPRTISEHQIQPKNSCAPMVVGAIAITVVVAGIITAIIILA